MPRSTRRRGPCTCPRCVMATKKPSSTPCANVPVTRSSSPDLLATEVAHRDDRRKLRMVREANFPRPKRIEDFDYGANPNIAPEQVNTLCDPAWVLSGQPLCLIGDSGTGKSHLLIGLGTAVAEAGYKVRYSTTANLVNELAEAADERQLTKVLTRYGRCDLLCLDEFGYLDLDKAGAKLLFQSFTDREERRAIAIASNAPFSEWNRTFTDPRLCNAILDRLTYQAHIIETGTDSYRLHSTTSTTAAAPSDASNATSRGQPRQTLTQRTSNAPTGRHPPGRRPVAMPPDPRHDAHRLSRRVRAPLQRRVRRRSASIPRSPRATQPGCPARPRNRSPGRLQAEPDHDHRAAADQPYNSLHPVVRPLEQRARTGDQAEGRHVVRVVPVYGSWQLAALNCSPRFEARPK